MRSRITIIATVALAALLVASVAYAGEGEATIDGRGTLVAAGVGSVEISGGGVVQLRMSGDVRITDNAGDAVIKVRSADDSESADGAAESTTFVLSGFTGVVTVEGSDFTVDAQGKFRRIAARGTGSAFLQGRGWYRTSGGHFGWWTPGGVRLDVAA